MGEARMLRAVIPPRMSTICFKPLRWILISEKKPTINYKVSDRL